MLKSATFRNLKMATALPTFSASIVTIDTNSSKMGPESYPRMGYDAPESGHIPGATIMIVSDQEQTGKHPRF